MLEGIGEGCQGAGALWLGEAIQGGDRVGGQAGQVGSRRAGMAEMVHIAGGDEAIGVEQAQGQQADRAARCDRAGEPGRLRRMPAMAIRTMTRPIQSSKACTHSRSLVQPYASS